MGEQEMVSLATLARGAAIERFDDELKKVLDNILDPNTTPDKVRSVSLTVRIKPDKDRSLCMVDVEAKAGLASPSSVQTRFFVGRANGKAVAYEHDPRQQQLFPEQKPTIVQFKREGEGA